MLGQFLLYNLLPSLIIGFLLWLLVVAAYTLLPIRRATLRLSLLAIPLTKSILILLGIGLLFRWPTPLFADWHARAVPVQQVLPFLLIWAGGMLIAYQLLVRHARGRMLRNAYAAPEHLTHTLDEVLLTYRETTAGSSRLSFSALASSAVAPASSGATGASSRLRGYSSPPTNRLAVSSSHRMYA